MPASYILSDARRRALLSSSFSPKLPDASHFPLSSILAKLPPLPNDPLLDAPFPPPQPPPTPGLNIDDNNDNALPQASTSDDLRPTFNLKTVPLPPDDNLPSNSKKRFSGSRSVAWWTRFKTDKKRSSFLGSRAVAWWTRFSTRA